MRLQIKKFPIWFFFPFFIAHAVLFGLVVLLFAYAQYSSAMGLVILFIWGFLGVLCYLMVYSALFGLDSFKWIVSNTALALFGFSAELHLLIDWFNVETANIAWYRNMLPYAYYVMYTFWFRQLVLAAFGAREDTSKGERVSNYFLVVCLLIYLLMYIA